MARVNEHYLKLQAGYLFPEIGRRVSAFQRSHPDAPVIKLGIGDITLPLAPAIVEALHAAVDEMGEQAHGYGPENGYGFLTELILEHDFKSRGVSLASNEIFVSDGSKQDSGNIQEIFGARSSLCVTDPTYPVYVDTNVMAGRTGEGDDEGRYAGIVYLPATIENQFMPGPPDERVELAYLCSPNNPTGAVATRENLQQWVDWARQNQATLLFDAAYDAFIQDDAHANDDAFNALALDVFAFQYEHIPVLRNLADEAGTIGRANGDIGDLVADRLDRSRTLHANSGGHFERIKTAAMIAIDIVQSDRLMPDTDLSSARRRNIDFCPAHYFGAALFLNDDGMGHDCILS